MIAQVALAALMLAGGGTDDDFEVHVDGAFEVDGRIRQLTGYCTASEGCTLAEVLIVKCIERDGCREG